jgi:cyclopropane fatty-acyl-phospholipid synthase-like methyltransferase
MPDQPAFWQNPDLAAKFLQNIRGSIPLAIEQIDMMLRLLAAADADRLHRFLELGCGDGVLSDAILDEHPNARGVLVDVSESALAGARQRLAAHKGRVEFIVADYGRPEWTGAVTHAGPFDAIVSACAAHHLPDARRRDLYGEIFNLLTPDGPFINIEHVASATRWTESIWDDYTIDAIFGQELKASPGKNRAEVAREYYARVAENAGILAPLEVQCDWLREIGFENVECYLKVSELALFGGQKPGRAGSNQ